MHALDVVAPNVLEYDPEWHAVQDVETEAEDQNPGPQLLHAADDEAARMDENSPGWHALHESEEDAAMLEDQEPTLHDKQTPELEEDASDE